MKKKLVAVGLAATLVLGTMPALAFGAPETGNKEFTNESGTTTGDTTVKVWTDTSNISAELPIDLVVYGPAEGGALTTPDTYAITNKSGFALDVKTAIATQTASQEADFTLANTSQSGTISPTGKIADLQIALTKKDGAKSWTIMKDGVAASDVLAEWTLGKSGAADAKLTLKASGTISKAADITGNAEGKAKTAVKITYTVAAHTTA